MSKLQVPEVPSPRIPQVHGSVVDAHTRCVHYAGPLDVVALKFVCCERYYPCFLCHDRDADHPHQPRPQARFDEPSILCGMCWQELSTTTYRAVDACPHCGAGFNPRCRAHASEYFETEPVALRE